MTVSALATYADVCTRMGDSTLDENQVGALLTDASAILLTLLGSRYDEDDELQAANLATVCCNMVSRALATAAGSVPFGVTQHSMTASSFNEQFTYSNPTGDLYLTALEKKLLGIGAARVYTLEPTIQPNFTMSSTLQPPEEE